MTFTLHPQLTKDTHTVADLPLCRLLLSNDKQYPWFILVPRIMSSPSAGIREISDVAVADQPQMWAELMAVHNALHSITGATKMNIAAIGNMVPQLHIHVVARFEGDPAWPKPIFGQLPPIPYQPSEAGQIISRLKPHLPPEWLDGQFKMA